MLVSVACLAGLLTTHVFASQLPLRDDASSSGSPFTSAFDDRVEELLKEWHTPGIAIAVVHGDETWTKGYGFASLPDEPMTPHTLMYGASTTKSFTASAASLLVDNDTTYKDVAWNTPLRDLIGDDFRLKGEWETYHTTLEDALSHRTGMPRHDFSWITHNVSIREQVLALRHLEPSHEIRTRWEYCNIMFSTVSHAIEIVTGRPLAEVFDEWLWKPLGMSETYLSRDAASACEKTNPDCKVATGYDWNNDTQSFFEIPWSIMPEANGAGGIVSNVHDYTKWVRALIDESGPVSKKGHEAIRAPHSFIPPEEFPSAFIPGPMFYGMGVFGGRYRDERFYMHNGDLGGFESRFTFFPDRKYGIITMQNAPSFCQDVLQWGMIDDLLKVPEDQRFDIGTWYHTALAAQGMWLEQLPSRLYPDVPSHTTKPTLPVSAYAGQYLHKGYGNMTLEAVSQGGDVQVRHSLLGIQAEEMLLVAEARFLGSRYVFHHVTGEYWLVEDQSPNGQKASGKTVDYRKARFLLGADGEVKGLEIIIENSLGRDDGWSTFERQ